MDPYNEENVKKFRDAVRTAAREIGPKRMADILESFGFLVDVPEEVIEEDSPV